MNFWQWLFGYTDEDIATLQKINRKKLGEARNQKKKTWQEEVDENSLEEYEMCQWHIDHKRGGKK